MKDMFTLQGFAMPIIIALVVIAYLSFFSVILAG
jgi:hypothetical protein